MKNLLKDTHPQLKNEWHPTKNQNISFDEVRTNSSINAWWRCRINPKHIWQAKVRRRAIEGTGCPYCIGRKVLRENSFAALYPEILEEWHPTKNQSLDPWALPAHSNKRVWWQCKNNPKHEWQTALKSRVRYRSGCRICNQIRNSLDKAFPEIAAEWHPTKNGDLTPADVASKSNIIAWWQCSKDPSHEWKTRIDTRTRHQSSCPICRKLKGAVKLPKLNSFSPQLAAQWHPIRNGNLTPADVTIGSNRKVWWICTKDKSHEWRAPIRNRAKRGTGCPFCAHQRKQAPEGHSLADIFPNIAREWHPTKNAELKPIDVTPGSAKRVWWQCSKDPSHEWEATIQNRTNKKSTKLCPYCSGFRVTSDNSLATQFPEIAAEWHPTKNGVLTPDKIKRASGKKVWWQCSKNPEHIWQAQIKNRTILGSGCPHCDREQKIYRLQESLFDSVGSNTDYYKTFLNGMRTLRQLVKNKFTKIRLQQPFFRMLYSSAITILETYLSDAFYHTIIYDDNLIEKFMLTTPEFNQKKYSLTEVIKWHHSTKQRISDYLFDIVWHNLAKVQNMYESILEIQFQEDISSIHRAVAIRHDLVHRNGRMKSGAIHKFEKDQIIKLFTEIEKFVQYIDEQLGEKKTEQMGAVDRQPAPLRSAGGATDPGR